MDAAVLEQGPSDLSIHPLVAGVGRLLWVPVEDPQPGQIR